MCERQTQYLKAHLIHLKGSPSPHLKWVDQCCRVIQPSVAVKARHKSQGHQVQGVIFTDTEIVLLLNRSKMYSFPKCVQYS